MINAPTNLRKRVEQAVTRFSIYADEIQSLMTEGREGSEWDKKFRQVSDVLNGGATLALQRLIPISIRKEAGLFFTSDVLAEKVADILTPMLKEGFKLQDPACGAGNLLLACARRLQIGDCLRETLKIWSRLIHGYDLYDEFVRTTKLRLVLLALSLHPTERTKLVDIRPDQIFSGLKVADALNQPPQDENTCIVINPPFGHMQAPSNCKWATGRIQIAAWFLEQYLLRTTKRQHLVAILPDVLRSGTRYHAWRHTISSLCNSLKIRPVGQFDVKTDVDVFIVHATIAGHDQTGLSWPKPPALSEHYEHVVSEFFEVSVGTVVPHRDPLEGPIHPYIHARTAPAWQQIDVIVEERKYAGRVFTPPFLVIRRTSSPRDKHRCVATIVNEKRNVAVENHLIVLVPRDQSLTSCKHLLAELKSANTNEWLNNRIRCRHLTVPAIRELPYGIMNICNDH